METYKKHNASNLHQTHAFSYDMIPENKQFNKNYRKKHLSVFNWMQILVLELNTEMSRRVGVGNFLRTCIS